MAYQNPVPENFLNPSENYYRIISAPTYEDALPAFRDLQKSGAIRGSDDFSGETYFNK
jgi:hypothetical protein